MRVLGGFFEVNSLIFRHFLVTGRKKIRILKKKKKKKVENPTYFTITRSKQLQIGPFFFHCHPPTATQPLPNFQTPTLPHCHTATHRRPRAPRRTAGQRHRSQSRIHSGKRNRQCLGGEKKFENEGEMRKMEKKMSKNEGKMRKMEKK
jgi:hypothetical protein